MWAEDKLGAGTVKMETEMVGGLAVSQRLSCFVAQLE